MCQFNCLLWVRTWNVNYDFLPSIWWLKLYVMVWYKYDANIRFWSVVFQGLSKYTIIAKVLFQKCNEFNMLNCSIKSTPCVVVKKFRFSELKIEKVIFFY